MSNFLTLIFDIISLYIAFGYNIYFIYVQAKLISNIIKAK